MIHLGLDLGSSSLKLAALAAPEDVQRCRPHLHSAPGFRLLLPEQTPHLSSAIILSEYRRLRGSPAESAAELLRDFRAVVPESLVAGVRVTGSSGRRVADQLGAPFENEFKAIARAVRAFYPQVRTVFEMGGETSKYLLLDAAADGRGPGILDYSSNGECAAGTGSFLDQQAARLRYGVEQIGDAAACASCAARIAGRCSVFAKSDMIHAQQRGFTPEQILKGLCEALARNFKSSVVKGRKVVPPVIFIGAVSRNRAVCDALRRVFHLAEGDFLVTELALWLSALGAALLSQQEPRARRPVSFGRLELPPPSPADSGLPPLSMESVLLLRDRVQRPALPEQPVRAFLGIDVGSVSTNLAVLDEQGRLLHEIYLRTVGRPIEVVHQGLQEIAARLAGRIRIAGVGTTGSGRELIGELVGADTINDEITAHKTGAMFISQTLVGLPVDTIFEIGGQDSKFISLENGVVVDFAMNEACAAGTGSFLEEQAELLGISIFGEFSRLALSSRAPVRLGERCTVFMERDLTAWMKAGAARADLAAGLAYSIGLNYLNRVVRGRRIGNVIFFQGGTAYNDAVAAAFAQLLGKRIIVPPYNGVMGAIGMALIAAEWARRSGKQSRFRGFSLDASRFAARDFVCQACPSLCEMKEITIDGQKTYWGDRCSDKFRKPARTGRQPCIADLLALRDSALLDGYAGPAGRGPRVGIPQAMFFYDTFPFWRAYLENLGFDVVLSGPTDPQAAALGVELAVAEPCFPVQIAHGLVKRLQEARVDFILLPNVMDRDNGNSALPAWQCPWNQTLPFVLRVAPSLAAESGRFLIPTLYFKLGPAHVRRQLGDYFSRLGISRRRSDAAVDAAYAAQAAFQQRLQQAGRSALEILERTREPAVLLLGRPYNLYDRIQNCDLPRKLRALYGVNVLPFDFLPLDCAVPDGACPNMYWYSGQRILAAGRFARRFSNLHILYVTNFKCGPDSFLKTFLRHAAGAPFLTLQFDGHGNDAGYLTRCEAYLDSKGVLRCYAAPSRN